MPGSAGEAMIAVCLIVAALVVASYPVIKFIGMWMEGEVEGAHAGFGILLYICLIAGVMGAPGPGKVILVLFIVASAVMLPTFMQVSDTIQINRMEDDSFAILQQALERDAMDAPARMELARMLHKRGELDQAIEHLDWILKTWPRLGYRVKAELDSWKREKERVGVPQPIFCHRCRAENAWNAARCAECEAQFGLRAGIAQQVAKEGGPKKALRGWIVAATVANVICFSLLYLPLCATYPFNSLLNSFCFNSCSSVRCMRYLQ